jgi:hypothetical protein
MRMPRHCFLKESSEGQARASADSQGRQPGHRLLLGVTEVLRVAVHAHALMPHGALDRETPMI